MKKFSLITEYSEIELKELIAEVVSEALQQTLSKHLIELKNSGSNNSPNELLDRKAVCKLLKITLPTLSKLQNEGKLKALIVGGSYRYYKKDIDNFLQGSR